MQFEVWLTRKRRKRLTCVFRQISDVLCHFWFWTRSKEVIYSNKRENHGKVPGVWFKLGNVEFLGGFKLRFYSTYSRRCSLEWVCLHLKWHQEQKILCTDNCKYKGKYPYISSPPPFPPPTTTPRAGWHLWISFFFIRFFFYGKPISISFVSLVMTYDRGKSVSCLINYLSVILANNCKDTMQSFDLKIITFLFHVPSGQIVLTEKFLWTPIVVSGD